MACAPFNTLVSQQSARLNEVQGLVLYAEKRICILSWIIIHKKNIRKREASCWATSKRTWEKGAEHSDNNKVYILDSVERLFLEAPI